ncbi:hypothetical protein F6476_13325 [Pseudomonas umsongensis]|uniref:hypothetical protein n=1 Tax=Pseudomonas umsongensis TaxID=198618 RepID=UPI001245A4AF|nr:hypothetical protein [Pseudomonas umsongensis]QFG30102.1 hypothetical protein F6476_13325 [Pseudomonas umsongensis]
MKVIKLILSLWIGLISFTVMAEDNQECAAAEKEAQEAFDRVKEAYNSRNQAKAAWHSQSFTEIYEKNKNCPFIKVLADQINSRSITKAPLADSDYGNLLKGCQTPCKAVIVKPGIGTGTGMGVRE